MIKFIHYILLLLFLSCDSNDSGLTPYKENYHRIEFDIIKNQQFVSKKIGVSNILIFNSKDYEKTQIIFHGIYKGILFISSSECGINKSFKYSGKFKIDLSDIVDYDLYDRCSLKLTLETEKIRGSSLIETGILNIIFKDKIFDSFSSSYTDPETSRVYKFFKENSFQIRAGELNKKYYLSINSPVNKGTLNIKGCKIEAEREINSSKLELNFGNFFDKNVIDRLDSCFIHLEIRSKNKTYEQFLYLSVFDKDVKRLSKSSFSIKEDILEVSSPSFVNICSINSSYILNTCPDTYITCSEDSYSNEATYWIRGITPRGRKNVYAIKNGEVIWEE
jgi:hypothetical protein